MQVDYVYLHFCLINSYKWRCITIAREVQHEINEEIRDREVRVIDANGEMLGVMPTKEAQKLADEKSLDLVKVSPNAKPPVCKILDYGKFRYEEMRRVKEAKKNQKAVVIKDVYKRQCLCMAPARKSAQRRREGWVFLSLCLYRPCWIL